jgi:hypothetical protein
MVLAVAVWVLVAVAVSEALLPASRVSRSTPVTRSLLTVATVF